jgi:glucose-1-phosphate thymidylyltransferase
MHAVVLAGGYATRLWPVTRNRPKMLLPVGEQTVIDRILGELESDDRIDEVYVSTNERFADDFERHLDASEFEKPRLSIEETIDEDEKLGVIGALAQLVDREGIDSSDLLVVAGDNLISFDLPTFLDFFETKGTPTLAAYDVGSPGRASSYGLVDLAGDKVVDFQEKPDNPTSTLVSIACYAFPSGDVRFAEYLEDGNNPDEPGWFIQWLQRRRPIHAFTFEEAWFDIGTPGSYLEAVSWALDGGSVVAPDATVDNSKIGDNVHVMSGATVVDSTLDRSIVFPEATVDRCGLCDSIVDREATLCGVDLSGALVGAHSRLR